MLRNAPKEIELLAELPLAGELRQSLRDPHERRNPGLESIEESLPGLLARAVSLVGTTPLFAPAQLEAVAASSVADEVAMLEARLRTLILDASLTEGQSRRVSASGRTLSLIDAVRRLGGHFGLHDDVVTGARERAWASACLTPAASAALRYGLMVVVRAGGTAVESARLARASQEAIEAIERAERSYRATVLLSATTARFCWATLHSLWAFCTLLGLLQDEPFGVPAGLTARSGR